jgi:Kef-type K+ transport system membrane component KefB
VASTSTLIPLGFDFLTFLSATVLVVPLCKQLKISPVLGFLASGVILEQLGSVCGCKGSWLALHIEQQHHMHLAMS